MSANSVIQMILLSAVVLACWLGALGMWRMREPTQALHYLSLPTVGALALSVAVFLKEGSNQVSWKTLLIAFVLLAMNSVVTHAIARAFRARKIGHWEPRDGDPFEFVRDFRDDEEAQ
ncbi:MAG TPA: monovalent cation/H(+) antiporter subunit G [Acidobacteriaceae bacterium]|nr:monovalent cation/H(+) antiporter subunit G [Acidobacteriaceae bacterium]